MPDAAVDGVGLHAGELSDESQPGLERLGIRRVAEGAGLQLIAFAGRGDSLLRGLLGLLLLLLFGRRFGLGARALCQLTVGNRGLLFAQDGVEVVARLLRRFSRGRSYGRLAAGRRWCGPGWGWARPACR